MKIYHLISERMGGRLYECKYSYDGDYILYIQLKNIPGSAHVWKAVYLVILQKPFDQIMKYNLIFKFNFLEQRFDFLFRNIKITKLTKKTYQNKVWGGVVSDRFQTILELCENSNYSENSVLTHLILCGCSFAFLFFNSYTSVSFFCRC